MKEVTQEQFFAAIGAMDVHPHPERYHSRWETRYREVVGRTEPGYLCRDKDGRYTTEKRYWLADRYAAQAEAA